MTGSGGGRGDDVLLSIVPRQKAVSHMIDTSIRGLFGGSLWDGAAKGGQHKHDGQSDTLYLYLFINIFEYDSAISIFIYGCRIIFLGFGNTFFLNTKLASWYHQSARGVGFFF